jgi:hypothetical protein
MMALKAGAQALNLSPTAAGEKTVNRPAGSGIGVFSESTNNRRLEVQRRFTF